MEINKKSPNFAAINYSSINYAWLMSIPCNNIDRQEIERFIASKAKRFCFEEATYPYLKTDERGTNFCGWVNLPFDQPIESIISGYLNREFRLCQNDKKRYYRRIDSPEEFQQIEDAVEKFKSIVFLRDCLDLSVALCMHDYQRPDGTIERTYLGQKEYELKYHPEECNVEENLQVLTDEMQKRLEQLPFYKDADYICAVPSSKPFMREIIQKLNGFTDISDKVYWRNKQQSIKELDNPSEKLNELEAWGLYIEQELTGKTILLVDDMYKSGVTMQYIAMKLKEAGARHVFGMTVCKAMGNK